MPATDAWRPAQYQRFAAERRQPFDDLLGLLAPVPGGRVLDLGCGTGELTVELHRHLGARATLGIDSSLAMLERVPTAAGVTFEAGDITTFAAAEPFDAVVSNAALQWVPGHESLFGRLAAMVAPGGQLAVQVPYNHDHPSHTVSAALAREEPFARVIGPAAADPVAENVLAPARYAELLHELGFHEQHVRLQVYGHVLDSTADVVEWTKGTSLTRFERLLAGEMYETFVDRYRARLVAALGGHRPYFYAFKRILVWARAAP
jgi:trans-aconitate 2-methyltransferase